MLGEPFKAMVGLLIVSTLTGCTGMHSQFGCNKTAPDQCIPVDRVNQQALVGAYDNEQLHGNRIQAPAASVFFETPYAGKPLRYGETIQRIWVAPFEDQAGNYHEPSVVYAVIQGSHWIGVNPS
jgi:conjugal transfer pilus assembly protein TraV